MTVLSQPPHPPDVAPRELFLSPKLRIAWKGSRVNDNKKNCGTSCKISNIACHDVVWTAARWMGLSKETTWSGQHWLNVLLLWRNRFNSETVWWNSDNFCSNFVAIYAIFMYILHVFTWKLLPAFLLFKFTMFSFFFSNNNIKIYETPLLFPSYGLSILSGLPDCWKTAEVSRCFLNASVPSTADSIIMHN